MFRLQNNVPEAYVAQSRDFQLFCRLFDLCLAEVRFSADSLARASSTMDCDSGLLDLLATKLGLFDLPDMGPTELRYLLQAYPTIIRYKGSQQALDYIATLYSKMYHVDPPLIKPQPDYTVSVLFSKQPENDKLIWTLLKYVLPTGYLPSYDVAETSEQSSHIVVQDVVSVQSVDSSRQQELSMVGSSEASVGLEQYHNDPLVMAVGLTDVEDGDNIESTDPNALKVYYNGEQLSGLLFNGQPIESVTYDGTDVSEIHVTTGQGDKNE